MNALQFIAGLEQVRSTGDHRWIARCPAHEDRHPSLSVRETDDGRLLVHDFGGCESRDILHVMGLSFASLFNKPLAHHLPPVRGGFTARQLLELLAHEATVAALLASDAQMRPLIAVETERLAQAASRLSKAQELAYGR